MKFTINTDKKIITLEESVNLNIFIKTITEILGDSWKDYTLEKTIHYTWSYPSITYNPITYDHIPNWNQPDIHIPKIICYNSTNTSGIVTTFDT